MPAQVPAQQQAGDSLELTPEEEKGSIDQQCHALCRKQHASRAMFRTCVTACDVEADSQLRGVFFRNAPNRQQIENVLAFEVAEEQRRSKQ